MKFSVSMPDELVKEIDDVADEMFMSRSAFLALSANTYLSSIKVQRTLTSLNLALAKISETGVLDDDTLAELDKFTSLTKLLTK